MTGFTSKKIFKATVLALLFWIKIACPVFSSMLSASDFKDLSPLLKDRDAVVVADFDGKILFSRNAAQPLIPASILKVLTSLAAFHYLGENFRFNTEFYIDDKANLTVKGYGDPLLISEVLSQMAAGIAEMLPGAPEYCRNHKTINHLFLDDTYFLQTLEVPGRTEASVEPYDSPNGALCANFNTVGFKRQGDTYISAEPQTPLLPMALSRIKKSKLAQGRILLSQNRQESTRYAGHLLAHFLLEQGIEIKGAIKPVTMEKEKNRLLFNFTSPFSLSQVISQLLEYSNNFIANQLLITIGIKATAPPGTLAKGSCAVTDYATHNLGIKNLTMVEGSGLSRKNRLSAMEMIRVLQNFLPYRHLMQRRGNVIYKTGTLTGISTRAGYVEGTDGEARLFVVMVNTPPARSAGDIVRIIQRCITGSGCSPR